MFKGFNFASIVLITFVAAPCLEAQTREKVTDSDARILYRIGETVADREKSPDDSPCALHFLGKANRLVVGRANGQLSFYEATTGKLIKAVTAQRDEIVGIVAGLTAEDCFSASVDGSVRRWSAKNGEALKTDIKAERNLWALARSNDGDQIAVASNKAIQVFDAKSSRLVRKITARPFNNGMAFSADDQTLLSAGHDVLQLWHVPTGKRVWERGKRNPKGVFVIDVPFFSGVAYSKKGEVAAASIDNAMGAVIQIWHARTGKTVQALRTMSWHIHFAFSRDGQWLFASGSEPVLEVWNLKTGQRQAALDAHPLRVQAVTISPDGKRLATGGNDGSVVVWDVEKITGK